MVGKTPGIEIWIVRDSPEWFSGHNILKFHEYFCSNWLNFYLNGFLFSGIATFLGNFVRPYSIQLALSLLIAGLKLNSSSWSMVRGKDYMGNLSEIQDRFMKGKYKGGSGCVNGKHI